MRVAFLFLHPFSGSLGSTVRVRELAISLNKLGVKTSILSPYEMNHVMENGVLIKSIPNMANKLRFSTIIYKFSRIAYYNKVMARKLLTSQRFYDFLANGIAKSAYEVIKNDDIGVLQAEQDIAVMPALRLAKKMGAAIVVDLHNITAEELVAAGVIARRSNEFMALRQQMAEALSQVDLIVVVSEEMKSYVHSEYGISRDNICVVPPGGRLRTQHVGERPLPPKVVFAGMVSYREHVDLFVKSMPIVLRKKPDTRFYMTKKGEDLKRIQKITNRLKVKPEYFWYPSARDFYKFLASCHIGTLPSTNDLARRMGTPAKLFAYMSVGLPVIANDIGAWTDIINQENIGIVTEDNPQSFASAILELLNDVDLQLDCGRRGLEAVKTKYSWDNSAKILLTEYTRLSSF